jgi:hypothetical protein
LPGVPHAFVRRSPRRSASFLDAAKFKARYATFGFSDKADLDDGNMWPTYFARKS